MLQSHILCYMIWGRGGGGYLVIISEVNFRSNEGYHLVIVEVTVYTRTVNVYTYMYMAYCITQ